MAQRVTQILVSDLTNEEMEPEEGQTVPFGLDGIDYEIDLFNDQAEELREILKPYIAAGRRTSGRAKRGSATKSGGSTMSREESKALREWARSEQLDVSERGRVPGWIKERYEAAHRGAAA